MFRTKVDLRELLEIQLVFGFRVDSELCIQTSRGSNRLGNYHVGSTLVHPLAVRMADHNRCVQSTNLELFGSFQPPFRAVDNAHALNAYAVGHGCESLMV